MQPGSQRAPDGHWRSFDNRPGSIERECARNSYEQEGCPGRQEVLWMILVMLVTENKAFDDERGHDADIATTRFPS
jgi:hypothetical protein